MSQLSRLAHRISRSNVTQAAAVNYTSVFVAAAGSILVARALGPEGRGQFAAIMAWFSLALVTGELGQSGAITHWVAKRGRKATSIIATGRLFTLSGSIVAGGIALVIAPLLAAGDTQLSMAYSIVFVTCFFNGFWGPYVYAAQAISIPAWNFIRLTQPISYVALIALLFFTNFLNIMTLATTLAISTTVQLFVAYLVATRLGITKGKPSKRDAHLVGRYGGAYYASQVPASISAQYDKAVLSQTVSDNALGQYAVAGTVASLGGPLAKAIASVSFPRLSADTSSSSVRSRSETKLILLTGGVTALVLLALCLTSVVLVPWIFGAEFSDSVVLIGLMAPAMWARALSEVVLVFIRSRGRPGLVTWARFAGLAVGALTIVPLINLFGVAGGAISLIALELITLLVSVFLLWKLRNERPSERNDE